MPPRAKLSSIRARASVAAGPINGWFELSSARHGRRNMNRHIKSFAPRVSRRQFMIGAAGLSFAIALDGTNVATVLAKQRTGEARSEEHTSELQSPDHLVCRLLLEKKK